MVYFSKNAVEDPDRPGNVKRDDEAVSSSWPRVMGNEAALPGVPMFLDEVPCVPPTVLRNRDGRGVVFIRLALAEAASHAINAVYMGPLVEPIVFSRDEVDMSASRRLDYYYEHGCEFEEVAARVYGVAFVGHFAGLSEFSWSKEREMQTFAHSFHIHGSMRGHREHEATYCVKELAAAYNDLERGLFSLLQWVELALHNWPEMRSLCRT